MNGSHNTFDTTLNEAIVLAEEQLRILQQRLDSFNKRQHPTQTRYKQRKTISLIDSRFSDMTTPEDFMVGSEY